MVSLNQSLSEGWEQRAGSGARAGGKGMLGLGGT